MHGFNAKFKLSIKELTLIIIVTFLPILLIYLPFLLKLRQLLFLTIKEPGFANVLKNWDGPHYLMISKTWYDLAEIGRRLFIPIDVRYYAAHFPLFPFLIWLGSFLSSGPYAGLLLTLFFDLALNVLFYILARKYTRHPLFLTFVFTVFPPRYLVTRSIIAPETLMVFLMLFSLYLWEKKQYYLSSLFGFFGVLTKIQALFLFPAYLFDLIEKRIKQKGLFRKEQLFMFLIPLAFIFLSLFYYFRLGDFFAFLRAEKGNNLYVYFPFSQFNAQNLWAGAWIEDVVFYFISMFTLTVSLWKGKQRSWFYFALFYTLFLVFIPQRDITRFAYPLLPLFLFNFQSFITSKVFKVALFVCLPAIYFYTINFMLVNQAPIADWSLLLK
jgi:Gpi18-like mannosyltransferase